jgi:hypothetical protein
VPAAAGEHASQCYQASSATRRYERSYSRSRLTNVVATPLRPHPPPPRLRRGRQRRGYSGSVFMRWLLGYYLRYAQAGDTWAATSRLASLRSLAASPVFGASHSTKGRLAPALRC